MKVERIKYSKHYHPINPGEWIGMDIILEENDDPLAAFAHARKIADAAYAQNNSTPGNPEVNVIQVNNKQNGDLAVDIASCTDLVVLDSLKFLVEKTAPHLMDFFSERRKALVKKESDELLKRSREYAGNAKKNKDENKL